MQTRIAILDDLPAVNAIYEHEVLTSTCTFDTRPRTPDQQRAWFDAHQNPAYPLYVADDGGTITGWATLSPWSDRPAYSPAVEASIYIHRDHRRKGIVHPLGKALIDAAGQAGHRVILARIEASNETSRNLLLQAGFNSVGIMHQVGQKFGRPLDVETFELLLVPSK
jgi:phosphinothricin acetyltransferase